MRRSLASHPSTGRARKYHPCRIKRGSSESAAAALTANGPVNQRTGQLHDAAASLWPVKHLPCGALLLSALSVSTAVAAQPQAPSGDELRSMYCVEVLRAEIDLQHHLISASDAAAASAITSELRQQWIDTSSELLQGLAKLEVVRYRLQAYMLPRIPALDSSALATAMRQGDSDFHESRVIADNCAAECNPGQTSNQQPSACSASCGDKDLLSRVSACHQPTWLKP